MTIGMHISSTSTFFFLIVIHYKYIHYGRESIKRVRFIEYFDKQSVKSVWFTQPKFLHYCTIGISISLNHSSVIITQYTSGDNVYLSA